MPVKEFILDDSFLVRTSGTSDGTQDKFCKDGFWFKVDRYGGEGLAAFPEGKRSFRCGQWCLGLSVSPWLHGPVCFARRGSADFRALPAGRPAGQPDQFLSV